MIANYFKIGLRILNRQRSYTLLNIVGLGIGIAVFVFIYLYVQSEIRFDRHWTNSEQIYRIWNEYALDNNVEQLAVSPFRLANDLRRDFPGVEATTKLLFTDPSDVNDMASLTYVDEVFEIPNITISDNALFELFDYNFLEGDPFSALSEPNSIVVSSEVASQIFGEQPALGKKLRTVIREYTVTGVIDRTCRPSHLNFDAVVSENSLSEKHLEKMNSDWFRMNVYSYVKLADTVDVAGFEARFNEYVSDEIGTFIDTSGINLSGYMYYHFEPIADVHFNTSLKYDSPSNIDFSYLIIFGIIAAFILLTASINYINLAMARSLKRAKEIGVRKVLGAFRKQLAMQHISEAFIVTLIAFVLSLSLVEFLMPQFNELVGKDLTLVGTLFSREGIVFGIILVLMIIILAVVSGIFPAFILSAFNPVNVLKGNNFFFSFRGKQRISAGGIRKILVTIQYIVSVGMIIATAIIFTQMNYLKDYELGFDEENIMVINAPDDTSFMDRAEGFTQALGEHPGILGVSATHNVPGYTHGKMMFFVGDTNDHGLQTVSFYAVDRDFFKVLDVPLVEGSFFEEESEEESEEDCPRQYIINEATAAFFKMDKPVGEKLDASIFEEQNGEVIGVVQNFNFFSLHDDVEPLVFVHWPEKSRYFMVEIEPDKMDAALTHVKTTWSKFNEGHFMHFTFLEEKLESLYAADMKMLSLFIYFSFFVIFISSLGLYGLSSFLIEQRTKEIGIRKILGGSEHRIILLLAKDYLVLVFIAGLIASVPVYYLMNKWLNTFAFHININGWYFVFGIAIALAFAFFTVLIRSYNVVRRSPAYALKYE